MVERMAIEEVVVALEGQRPVLGDGVVETAVAALRQVAGRPAPAGERKQVTVMFAHAQDDVRPGRSIEHRVELPKMMGDMFSYGRRNREVAACEFDLHPNAPFFHAPSGGDRGGRLPDGSLDCGW